MILAIDVGNIRTTIALFDREGALSFQSELETDEIGRASCRERVF